MIFTFTPAKADAYTISKLRTMFNIGWVPACAGVTLNG